MATQQDRINGLLGDLGVKPPVRVATTTAITLYGEQTIDGVSVVAEDRVLVKNQADTTANGIYYCQATSWVRAPDFDGVRDTLQGTLVVVALGTTNAGTLWRLTTASPVIGTSNLTFALFPISASAFVQTLLGSTNAAAFLLGLGVPPYSQGLIGSPDAPTFLTGLGVSPFIQTLLPNTTAAAARATLGLGYGPAFSASDLGPQSLTTGTPTGVTLGTKDFDTNSNFASNRFTPAVAGYYQISFSSSIIGSTITNAYAAIYKNGSQTYRGGQYSGPSITTFGTSGGFLVSMNGSTDYLELYAFASGTVLTINSSKFSGFLARPA